MNAIVIGASSGMGRELVKKLCLQGYKVAATARRLDQLISLKDEISGEVVIKQMDISNYEETIDVLQELIAELSKVELIIISAGVLIWNSELDYKKDLDVIAVNVAGFTVVANFAVNYFIEQNKGHLVMISSISGLRGSDKAPSYPASKAYTSNYLQGLRKKVVKSNKDITITDIKPGYVQTSMVDGSKSFWMATVDVATEQIINAIRTKTSHAYVTKRWRLMAWLMKTLPNWIYHKL